MHRPRLCQFRWHASVLAIAFLVACGGSNGRGASIPPAGAVSPPTTAMRVQAITATAQSDSNACAAARPFYWEIGDATAAMASGSVASSGTASVTANTTMPIASASKWLYASYIAEVRAGVLTAQDILFLNFRSGYNTFSQCLPAQTVGSCLAQGTNDVQNPSAVGKFDYGGGHMQKHAALNGLGPLDNAALAVELRTRLGTDLALSFVLPQPAGGAATTAAEYARFLRKLLGGQLRMGALLGSHAVCTNPLTCPQALAAPISPAESWHYEVGHWVEDDPVVGDGAFSSVGAFGFYPWIDASKTTYGVVARQSANGGASVPCGRLMRKAWASGVAQ